MTTANETDGRKPATGLTFAVRGRGGSVFEVAVIGPFVTIGRDRDCTVCVGDVPTVSGRHAEITVRDGRCTIEDTRSQNHTFVNGVRIDEPVPLRLHDEIGLGMNGPRLRLVAIGAARRPEPAAGHHPAGEHSRDLQAAGFESAGAEAPAPRRARDLLVARRSPERAPEPAALAPDRLDAQRSSVETGATTSASRHGAEAATVRRRAWLPPAALSAALLLALGGAWSVGLLPAITNWRALLGMTDRSVALIRCVTKGRVFPEIVSESSGSGFLIDSQGRVATTFHVIDGIDEATVRFAGDDAWHAVAGAVFASPGHDLAILDIGAAAAGGRRPRRLEPSPPAGNDEVVAIGSSGGMEFVSSRGKVEKTTSLGSLTERLSGHPGRPHTVDEQAAARALEQLRALRAEYDKLDAGGKQEFFNELFQVEGGPKVTRRDWIRHLEQELADNTASPQGGSPAEDVSIVIHDAAIAEGNSGGPLLDAAGAVVGVNAGGVQREGVDRDVRYAIAARHLVENLPPAGAAAKPFTEAAR